MPFEWLIEQNNDEHNDNEQKLRNNDEQITYNTSASNCNNIILFVMLDKNKFVGIFRQQGRWRGKHIVDRFSESIQEFWID